VNTPRLPSNAPFFNNWEANMKAVAGVFKSRSDTERGAAELVPLEIPKA
jgi:hypothetical protein